MSKEEDTTKAQRVVKYNEKFNVPEQTEEDDVGRSWIIISLSL
jgi:hypothetical protein